MLRDVVQDMPLSVTTLEIRFLLNWWILRKTDVILETLHWQVLSTWLTTRTRRPRQLVISFEDVDSVLGVDVARSMPSPVVTILRRLNLSLSFPSAGQLAITLS